MNKGIVGKIILIMVVTVITASNASGSVDKERFSLGNNLLASTDTERNNSALGALTAKYGLLDKEPFKPYIGAGLAYSVDKELKGSNPATRIRTGLAYQIGFNFLLNDKSSLNLDYNLLNVTADTQHLINDSQPDL